MKMRIVGAMCVMLIYSLVVAVSAQQMPQDSWYVERSWGRSGTNNACFNHPEGITVDSNGLVYVVDSANDRIQVFQPDGTFVRKWGSAGSAPGQFIDPNGIAIDTNGLVYVADGGSVSRIQVFQPDGTFVRKWGSAGSAPGYLKYPKGIAIDTNNLVYVADCGNNRIQVFEPDGTFVRSWGGPGSAPGQFGNGGDSPRSIGIDMHGLLYVADWSNYRIQVFLPDGTFVRSWGAGGYVNCVVIGPDQLVYTDNGVYDRDGTKVRDALAAATGWFAFAPNGIIYASDQSNSKIWALRRAYRNPSAMPLNCIPVASPISVEQRSGAPYLDIDYQVTDTDNSNVAVAVLAFLNGSNTLNDILKVNTLIEGTATNIGPAVPANQVNRLTWNAAADWATNFGQVKIEILAKDNRDLLNFHFLRIPSNGPDPELMIDRTPLTQTNLLSCWYWLIATSDPVVTLTTGTVFGVTGPYAGKVLAKGVNTTVDGRAFLFERLGVREATSAEVSRAKMGYTPGVTNQWTPRLPGDPRRVVNELGFDTYNYGTNAWFVVKP
jgi:sugar lactone lactonase YvrE